MATAGLPSAESRCDAPPPARSRAWWQALLARGSITGRTLGAVLQRPWPLPGHLTTSKGHLLVRCCLGEPLPRDLISRSCVVSGGPPELDASNGVGAYHPPWAQAMTTAAGPRPFLSTNNVGPAAGGLEVYIPWWASCDRGARQSAGATRCAFAFPQGRRLPALGLGVLIPVCTFCFSASRRGGLRLKPRKLKRLGEEHRPAARRLLCTMRPILGTPAFDAQALAGTSWWAHVGAAQGPYGALGHVVVAGVAGVAANRRFAQRLAIRFFGLNLAGWPRWPTAPDNAAMHRAWRRTRRFGHGFRSSYRSPGVDGATPACVHADLPCPYGPSR